MRKHLFFATLALLALTSCGSDNELTVDNNVPSPIETAQSQVPIAFGTYIGRSTTSRAATEVKAQRGDIDDTVLKTAGFGVFAYHTGADKWTAASSATPNYMYNERVTYNSTTESWEYWPVKFWPNDFNGTGAVDTQTTGGAATGRTSNYISFFSYAPYAGKDDTSENPNGDGSVTSDGQGGTGIIGISANSVTGAPIVTYQLGASDNVDLLWGTAADDEKSKKASDGTTEQSGTLLPSGKGNVWVDLVKPRANDKIKFIFKHALAKVGGSQEGDGTTANGLQVVLDINDGTNITGGTKGDETKVTVKSISIVNDGTFKADGTTSSTDSETKIPAKATLNLATGVLTNVDGSYTTLSQHITVAGTGTPAIDKLNTKIAEPSTPPTKDTWSTTFDANLPGVTTTAINVYDGADGASSPLYFIPGTTPHFKVTVNYLIRTKDNKLANGFSVAEQTISKIVTLPKIESNKKYNLIIHLGLTDIRFTATVSNWETPTVTPAGGGDATEVKIDVHVPQNVSGS